MTIRKVRIASQLFFFAFFLYLFWITSKGAASRIPPDLFLRSNPLLAVVISISVRIIIPTMIVSVILLVIGILLGRVFCGWVCPLGTIFDITSKIAKTPVRAEIKKVHKFKYYLLIAFFIAAIFGFQAVFYFDPIAMTTRIFTTALLPTVVEAVNFLFSLLFNIQPLQIPLMELQSSLADSLIPLKPYYFQTGVFWGFVFIIIIGFEIYGRRFFCQSVCPLGAFYGIIGKAQLLRRRVSEDCIACGECLSVCKTNAIAEDYVSTDFMECIQCFNCVDVCPTKATVMDFKSGAKAQKTDLTRRTVIASGIGGLAFATLGSVSYIRPSSASKLIRPPGSVDETEFVERCVRCYQCLRACATSGNFLQPSLLEGGLKGLLTPYGVARTGYCEFNCTLCTEVCPTGAIERLDLETKQKTVIGLAHFDKEICLPYSKGVECMVCEEHCPTGDKAIKFTEKEYIYADGSKKVLKFPYIMEDICIGCGICVYKCPVEGSPGIYITNQNQQRFDGKENDNGKQEKQG